MRVCGCVCVSARTRERGRARERERESEEAVCVGWVVCIVWSEAGRRDTERRVKRAVWRGVRSSGGAWSEMCGRGVDLLRRLTVATGLSPHLKGLNERMVNYINISAIRTVYLTQSIN